MSSRLVGAVLALTAAALLATSIATGALWSGPPTIATEQGARTIDKKTVHVGLLGAQGCNTGGDGHCQSVELAGVFPAIGYGALGTQGILLLALLGLGAMSFAKSDARRGIAKVALITAIVAAAVTGALVAIGPSFKDGHISVPIGYGMFLFAGAVLATIVASVLAPKDDPPPKLRPSRTSQPRLPQPPPQPELNVADFLAPDPVPQRPSNPSYPPPLAGTPSAFGAAPYQGPGPNAPGFPPNGPHGPAPGYAPNGGFAPNGPNAGFAPNGPNGGFAPNGPSGGFAPNGPNGPAPGFAPTGGPPPGFNPNGPAPIPPTGPRPIGPPPPVSAGGMLPGPAGPLGASSAPMFGEQPNFTPPQFPLGGREPEPNAPPMPAIPPGPRTKATSVVPPPRGKSSSIAPPLPGLGTGARPKQPSMSPPFKVPTIPPFVAAGSAPSTPPLPGLPGLPPMTPPPEEGTDPEAKALRPGTNTGMGVNESTDANATPLSDEDAAAIASMNRESESDLAETVARPKMDPEELEATNDIGKLAAQFKADNAPRAASEDGTEAATVPRRDGADVHASSPRPESKPAVDDAEALAKIPVTTASEDLPPPKEEKSAAGSPSPACPQCEAPMTWVEEHLRFYCKSCRMYF